MGHGNQRELVGPAPVHADAFHVLHADELYADIIAAVPLVGNVHQLVGALVQVPGVRHQGGDFGGFDGGVHAVGTLQEDIARQEQVLGGLGADEHLGAYRAAQQVARLRAGRCSGRKHSQPDLLVDQGVVAREHFRAAVANQVATRIADMGHHHAVETEHARDQGGRHRGPALGGGHPGLEHVRVGRLHQTRQERPRRLPAGCRAEPGKQALDGGSRRHLAQVLPADSVG